MKNANFISIIFVFIICVSFFFIGAEAQAQFQVLKVSDWTTSFNNNVSSALNQLQGEDGYIEIGDWATAFVEGGNIVEWNIEVRYGTY